MRKALAFIPICLAVALSVTGCDFFRKLAGRPTSVEIEAIREAVAEREAMAVKETADTTTATAPVSEEVRTEEPEVKESPETARGPAPVSAPVAEGKKRYFIVVASFTNPDNARKSLARMADRGYPGELLSLKGGYTGVGICGTNDEMEAKESLKELKRQDFCPPGVWIIDRNKR